MIDIVLHKFLAAFLILWILPEPIVAVLQTDEQIALGNREVWFEITVVSAYLNLT